jgi:hypothetical protein
VLLIDRRNHIGGNAYDHFNEAGLLVHKYGPHISGGPGVDTARQTRGTSPRRLAQGRDMNSVVLASLNGTGTAHVTHDELELWGGVECTLKRVGSLFIDQLELSGHARRLDDMDVLAHLGVQALRFPLLWERTAPRSLVRFDWAFGDRRMPLLQARGIRPIVGLLHHGSGPEQTHLLDPDYLQALREQPCPPDIIGVNYYATSDRFLDERLERYPSRTHGGNDRERYADVETVRVAEASITGYEAILLELWQRYGLPLAITEAHLGCTREQQLRWLCDAWNDAEAARLQGADVRAVTAWSLLGSVGWDQLVTRPHGNYEPGVFDVLAGAPRPTALARGMLELRARKRIEHPVAQEPGWWRLLSTKCPFPVCLEQGPGLQASCADIEHARRNPCGFIISIASPPAPSAGRSWMAAAGRACAAV